MDIRRTDVLNDYRSATEQKDEKHICPLQIGVIERLIALWTNKGERVFSPYAGIGSEVYQSVIMDRFGIGIELKKAYYDVAIKNCNNAALTKTQLSFPF